MRRFEAQLLLNLNKVFIESDCNAHHYSICLILHCSYLSVILNALSGLLNVRCLVVCSWACACFLWETNLHKAELNTKTNLLTSMKQKKERLDSYTCNYNISLHVHMFLMVWLKDNIIWDLFVHEFSKRLLFQYAVSTVYMSHMA